MKTIFALISFALAVVPAELFACGACIGRGYSQSLIDSYVVITILLSGLPLIFGGLLIYYMVKRSKSGQ
ncbi:MAG TPA: hypothetical protein PKE49_04615 [Leptospiraceae bacterium]|jgi:hypothetical protein|nr:hypothetical protein [Leptospirales bacterium]HMU83901.1 hypothetical protein [Leptospiraceae bacterium]HMW61825.1 hypothetical protein [Leptospiraceae bacterium]HMX55781.1 hypothetical protein [Leptospiraceae bacterium]HMY45716.1 hypothetical protein [Leptospiraceae bacterium]